MHARPRSSPRDGVETSVQQQLRERAMRRNPLSINEVAEQVIGAAIAVHRALGPGLLESAYETCLAYELGRRGLAFERQKQMPITYAGERLDKTGYRLDLPVENEVIVELKVAAAIDGVHVAQMMTYLRLSGRRAGLLITSTCHC
jgi:GxxExxY protein